MAEKKPKKLTLEELATQYGYAASFFFSDPELKRLIQAAVKGQWTSQKFQAKFQTTRWFRSKASSVRTWLELKTRDPAEAASRINAAVANLRNQAAQMGAPLSAARARKMAEDSLLFGWNDQQTKNFLAAEMRYSPGKTSGQAAATETFINQLANDYGVPVTAHSKGMWLQAVARGEATEDHLVDWVKDIAKSRYPGMTAYLDQGMTVRDVAEPYVQSYASLLEMNPELVEVTDPRIQQALQGAPPEKPGTPPVMKTLYEFERDIRKDPRWLKTRNANEQMTNAAIGVLQDFGLYS